MVPWFTKSLIAYNLKTICCLNDSRWLKGMLWSVWPQIALFYNVLMRHCPYCLYIVFFLHVHRAAHAYHLLRVDNNMLSGQQQRTRVVIHVSWAATSLQVLIPVLSPGNFNCHVSYPWFPVISSFISSYKLQNINKNSRWLSVAFGLAPIGTGCWCLFALKCETPPGAFENIASFLNALL